MTDSLLSQFASKYLVLQTMKLFEGNYRLQLPNLLQRLCLNPTMSYLVITPTTALRVNSFPHLPFLTQVDTSESYETY